MSRECILRSHYLVLICSNLISARDTNLYPQEDILWTLYKIGNIKVSSEPNFSVYGQDPTTYTGRYVSEKTHIFAYSFYCDVFHLLA